jgi:hypothetical protein
MWKYPVSPVTRQMQIKPIRSHYTPTRMTKIKNWQQQLLERMWSSQNTHHHYEGSEMAQPLWNTEFSWRVEHVPTQFRVVCLKKIKPDFQHLLISLVGILPPWPVSRFQYGIFERRPGQRWVQSAHPSWSPSMPASTPWLSNPIPSYYPREIKTYVHKKSPTKMFTAALTHYNPHLETIQLPSQENS